MVCDVALPFVRTALAADAQLEVRYAPKPGDGTQIDLVNGDVAAFEARVRAAVAQANR